MHIFIRNDQCEGDEPTLTSRLIKEIRFWCRSSQTWVYVDVIEWILDNSITYFSYRQQIKKIINDGIKKTYVLFVLTRKGVDPRVYADYCFRCSLDCFGLLRAVFRFFVACTASASVTLRSSPHIGCDIPHRGCDIMHRGYNITHSGCNIPHAPFRACIIQKGESIFMLTPINYFF